MVKNIMSKKRVLTSVTYKQGSTNPARYIPEISQNTGFLLLTIFFRHHIYLKIIFFIYLLSI